MKKIGSLVLAFAMVLVAMLAFAGCGDPGKGVKVIDIPLTEEEYAFAVRKGDTELLNQLNTFMAEIEADGTFDEIVNKYFGDGEAQPVESASEMKTDGSQLIVAEDDTTFDACQTKEDVEAILRTLGADVVVGVQTSTTGQKYCEGDADWGFDGFGFTTRGYTNGAVAVQNILNKNIQYVVIDEGPAKSIVKRVNAAN